MRHWSLIKYMAPLVEALAARRVSGTPEKIPPGFNPNQRPSNGYVAFVRKGEEVRIAAQNGVVHDFTMKIGQTEPMSVILPALSSRLQEIDINTHWRTYGAAGLNGDGRQFAADSWNTQGRSTILFGDAEVTDPKDLLPKVQAKHSKNGIRQIDIVDGRVFSSMLSRWTDYEKETPKHIWNEQIAMLENIAPALDGVVMVDYNTTPKAGGVAGMNHPKQRFIEDFNETQKAKGKDGHPIDYRWMLSDGKIDPRYAAEFGVDLQDPELLAKFGDYVDPKDHSKGKAINIFKLTKLRHVILQKSADLKAEYTEKDNNLYLAWSKTQYMEHTKPMLEQIRAEGKRVVIKLEDQQKWGELQFIRKDFPMDPDDDFLRIILRNHIHSHAELARDRSTQQYQVGKHVIDDLGYGFDLFMSHLSWGPRDEFLFRDEYGRIHPTIADRTAYAVASFDDRDGLGRATTDLEKPYLAAEANDFLRQTGQTPDNFDLPGVGFYARDDESKRIATGMLAYGIFAQWLQEDGVPVDLMPPYRNVAMAADDDPSGDRIDAAILIGLHPELADRYPQELKDSFTKQDLANITNLQAMVAENPWIADKIKKWRLNYADYDDTNRKFLEETCPIAGQYSNAEACEDQISRWVKQGTYCVTTAVGGMPDQIEDGVSGKIIPMTNDEKEIRNIAMEFYNYFTNIYPDPEVRQRFQERVKQALKPQYTTLWNVVREAGAAALVAQHAKRIPAMIGQYREGNGQYPTVHDLLGEFKPKPESTLPSSGNVFISPN